MVFISETASLISGVDNWMVNYYGMSVTRVNQLYPMDRNVPYQQHEIPTRGKNSLVIPNFGTQWNLYTTGNLLELMRELGFMPNFVFSLWKSLTLPWWLVEDVASKFGIILKVTKFPTDVCIGDNEEDEDEWEQGYPSNANTMWATIAILTSADIYITHGRYQIL